MQSGKFKFEKLQVWQLAMDFGESVYKLSETFPALEKFNLVSQINRAVDSVALNIAEGATGNSDAEFDRFLGYSLRSLTELFKAIRRNYITEEAFDKHYEEAFVLMNKIAALRNSISK